MQFGLLISVLLHAAILGGALFSIQSRQQLRVPEPEPVAVGMISPGDVTKVRMGVKTAKLLESMAKESPKGDLAKKKAAKPPRTAAAAPPPPPPPPAETKSEPVAPKAAAPPPAPDPAEDRKKLEAAQQERDRKAAEQKAAEKKAAEQKRAEQKRAEGQKQAEAQRRAEEERRAEAQKKAEEQKRAEEKRRAEEQKEAEERKRAEEKRRRQAELKKKKEAERRKAAALKKKREEEERRRREAEAAKKKRFNADKIAALLNKVPDAAPPPASAPPTKPTDAKGPSLGAPDGRDQQISASELAMIVQAIRTCVTANWRVLSGGASAQETSVRIRLRFNQDGTLSKPPQIVNPQRTPYFLAISESALRAVQQCEPYNLPPEKYEVWKDLVMNFSPTDMY